jgi:hypothetical protein
MAISLARAGLFAAAVPFCAMATDVFQKPSEITTEVQAAASLHAAFAVQTNLYFRTFLFAQPAESIALQFLAPSSPAMSSQAPAPVVVHCPSGGNYVARWSRLHAQSDSEGAMVTLLVEYNDCRDQPEGSQTMQVDNGPIAIRVLLPESERIRVLSVRHGSSASESSPARNFTREFIQRVPEGDFLETRLSSNHEVAGRFMQSPGDSGRFEGDFSYDINGFYKEEQFVFFGDPSEGLQKIERTFTADGLSVSGFQRQLPGPDAVPGTEDDTFDIHLRYPSGTLTFAYRDPLVAGEMPFRLKAFRLTDREMLVSGQHRITMDGSVSIAYPAFAAPGCTDGTFRLRTREPLVNQVGPFLSPFLTQGSLQINRNVVADFQPDGSIDVSLDGGTPVRYDAWVSLEAAIQCFSF